MTLNIKVFTLYPEMFPGPLSSSLLGRALDTQIWSLETINIRDFALDSHKTVDDRPCGGGPGMVLKADIVNRALEFHYHSTSTLSTLSQTSLIYLSPRGIPLTQDRVKKLAQSPSLGLLCGRFEGVDQRVLDTWHFEEISIGDFILTGGELPAMMLIDACIRMIPGVVGSSQSLKEESFTNNLLEYPHYTRPRLWQGSHVPEVLLQGDHQKIELWRRKQAEEITQKRRPDLWQRYCAGQDDKKGQ